MQDQPAVLEDGEDLFGKGWKVICITFVAHDSVLEGDKVALFHRVDSIGEFDHGKAIVDRVSKEDA